MNNDRTDLPRLLKVIKKHAQMILSMFLGFILIALAISLVIPPTYEAETALRIKQPKGLGSDLFALPIGSFNPKQLMETYAEIIKSRTVIQGVIDKTQSGKEEMPTYEDMVRTITTQPVKDTEILKINVRAQSPTEAQVIANTLVETLVERLTILVRAEQTSVREFIGQRLQESKIELERAESAIERFKRDNKIVAPTEQGRVMLDRLSAINKLQADNEVATAVAQARHANAQRQLAAEKPGFFAENAIIDQYKSKLAELEVEHATLLQNYTEKHPKVVSLRAAIDETKKRLSTEIARVVNSDASSVNPIHQVLLQAKIQADAEISAAHAQKAEIDRILAENERDMSQLPAKEQSVTRLMREAQVAQEIYVMLAKRHEEARISEVMQPTELQIIDAAIAPVRPISPRKGLNAVIAGMLGLFIGVALAMYMEYSNRTIRSAQEASDALGLPVLATVPDIGPQSTIPSVWVGSFNKIKMFVNGK